MVDVWLSKLQVVIGIRPSNRRRHHDHDPGILVLLRELTV
jgi:hypothetical protein